MHDIGFVYGEFGGRESRSLRTTGTRGREKYVIARSCFWWLVSIREGEDEGRERERV